MLQRHIFVTVMKDAKFQGQPEIWQHRTAPHFQPHTMFANNPLLSDTTQFLTNTSQWRLENQRKLQT
jgi:hypothetical protein